MSAWISRLAVFLGPDGCWYVSAAIPPSYTRLQIYDASGPYLPIGWPAPTPVDDPAQWMEDLRARGFSFRLAA